MSSQPKTPPVKTMLMRPDQGAAADRGPILVVVEGLEPGRRFALAATTTTIGRGTDNQIVLPSPAVSANHARIASRDGQFWIEDLRSTNGVVVNGSVVRVEEPRTLGNGDAIRISDHLLLFHHGGAQHASMVSAIEVDHDQVSKQVDELLREIHKPPS
jgi:pSer/pThr/pTyr-binding forkhead associated (FHA) protein